MDIQIDHNLGDTIFFMEENAVQSGTLQSIQITRNLSPTTEHISTYQNGDKVQRPWGMESTVYAVTVEHRGTKRNVFLRANKMFVSKTALLESL